MRRQNHKERQVHGRCIECGSAQFSTTESSSTDFNKHAKTCHSWQFWRHQQVSHCTKIARSDKLRKVMRLESSSAESNKHALSSLFLVILEKGIEKSSGNYGGEGRGMKAKVNRRNTQEGKVPRADPHQNGRGSIQVTILLQRSPSW